MNKENKNAYYWLRELLRLNLPNGFHITVDDKEISDSTIEPYGNIEDYLEHECNAFDNFGYISLRVWWYSIEPKFCYDIIENETIAWAGNIPEEPLNSLNIKCLYEKVKAFIELANSK